MGTSQNPPASSKDAGGDPTTKTAAYRRRQLRKSQSWSEEDLVALAEHGFTPEQIEAQEAADDEEAATWTREHAWAVLAEKYAAMEDVDDGSTSWRGEPLSLGDLPPQPEAQIMRRGDGQGLIYPGMPHAFFGDADSMKSWALNFVVKETVEADENIMYLDMERSRETFVRRMASIGTDRRKLRQRCSYLRPLVPLWKKRNQFAGAAWDNLGSLLGVFDPAILVIDGVTEFMALHGLDPFDPVDTVDYQKILMRRWPGERTTIEVDHTAKAAFGKRTQFGSQQKRAGVGGAVFRFEKVKGMTAGIGGTSMSRIWLHKDNEGGLWEHCTGDGDEKIAGCLRLDSTGEPWKLELLAPDTWGDIEASRKKLTAADRAVAVLGDVEMTAEEVMDAVNDDGGTEVKLSGIKAALNNLRRAGSVTSRIVPGKASLWWATGPR